ncbi:GAF domain-containing protein [Pseudaestuariivita atlantica]|uniref:GAF domain-containing protein n=1 Tax=Pseudaestuariivita atlantica TaxID=1317121 RepID=A0A0L1JR98_9RHOB|nr:GAF domain-containing protein [Pseudaestuariivita atlantica]KNG94314.1 hypothetical protein ATO11_08920 [Pseudaestuariivita atlantica]
MNSQAQVVTNRDVAMDAAMHAILSAVSTGAWPLGMRFIKALDAFDALLGFRRSALVHIAPGCTPVLVGHARDATLESAFAKDVCRVQSILSRSGENGVIRSALSAGDDIVLNDVNTDLRYIAGDAHSSSEACLVVDMPNDASLAFNVECRHRNAFNTEEVDFLKSLADLFAMALFRDHPDPSDQPAMLTRQYLTLS